ncbi:Hsp70 protein that interacts with Zuo1p [Cryptotrichosporon argae]
MAFASDLVRITQGVLFQPRDDYTLEQLVALRYAAANDESARVKTSFAKLKSWIDAVRPGRDELESPRGTAVSNVDSLSAHEARAANRNDAKDVASEPDTSESDASDGSDDDEMTENDMMDETIDDDDAADDVVAGDGHMDTDESDGGDDCNTSANDDAPVDDDRSTDEKSNDLSVRGDPVTANADNAAAIIEAVKSFAERNGWYCLCPWNAAAVSPIDYRCASPARHRALDRGWTATMSPTILGVNFGQSYASIAVIDKEGHAACIANEDGERQIACAVSYVGEQVYIGNGAKPHLVKNGKNTIMGFRNLLGHTYDEVDHTAILTAPLIRESVTPAYTVDILVPPPAAPTPGSRSAAPSGAATPAPAEPTPAKKTITAPEVTSLFLSTLLASATDFLGATPEQCVLSAPTWFTPAQTEALRAAAEAAGIHVVQVLDEAAAVLVGYRAGLPEERAERGLLGKPDEGDAGEVEAKDKKVVVLDMGETSLAVSVIAVNDGEYTVLGKGRDDKLGGREFDNLLLKHFAKEFTKKTKIALELPCTEGASDADKRAEAKLRLAVEHTKRSLSASSGAATCAVESLKDGYDLSSAINRIRFDGLAGPVYARVTDFLRATVERAGLDLAQIDEVLLAGASTLFPGLQSTLAYALPPSSPVTAALDPAEAIAVGCALQALHLANLDARLKRDDVLALAAQPVPTTAAPIGIVLPGADGDVLAANVVEAGAALPVRRRVAIPVASTGKVGLEIWEGKDEVKVEKVERAPADKADDDDEDDEEEDDEETRTPVTRKVKALGGVEVDAKDGKNVLLEIIVNKDGGIQVAAWEEGNEAGADRFEA